MRPETIYGCQGPDSLYLNSGCCSFATRCCCCYLIFSSLLSSFPDKVRNEKYLFSKKNIFFLLFSISSNNVFFHVFKFRSYWIMVFHDPNYGKMYFNCSNVCEIASGLLTPRGRHNWRYLVSWKVKSVYDLSLLKIVKLC